MMKRFALAALMIFGAAQAQSAMAQVGDPGAGMALAGYNPTTGEVVVSINGVNNWFITSASGGFTGAEPDLTTIVGSLPSNDDGIIGETAFATATVTDHSLGNVAALGLAIGTPGDMVLSWNAGLGQPLLTSDIIEIGGMMNGNPAVAALATPADINIFAGPGPFAVTLDATASTDGGDGGGPLMYEWDLDGSNTFATAGGSTLNIPDVVAQFGGLGSYPVAVRVTDSDGSSTASSTVNLVPEPGSIALACVGLIGIAATRRRRSC